MIRDQMWIREVDVPAALVEAHEKGELVIFVGAGASMAPPSNLPNFRVLAKRVAEDFNQPAPTDRLTRPDLFLGDLDDNDAFDVHSRVAARIDVPDSLPNDLHRAVVALAATRPPVRIVTTNYDLHLTSVLEATGAEVFEYTAPALPVGDNFTGLIYLHGRLRRDPKELVVTDSDFGRAYLRDAWAARFLDRMFSKFTVLFVGYSHEDVVMTYLARGLTSTPSRFVLTDEPERENWRRLGVVPVAYPNSDKTHRALVDAVAAWGEWATLGMLDHRQRVADLVATPPPQVPEQVSYLEAILSSPEKVGLFTELASGDQWLAWACSQLEVRRLFEPTISATDCTRPLADWFARQVFADEACSVIGLSVHRAVGGRMRPETWGALSHCLIGQERPLPAWLRPWIVMVTQDDPRWVNSHLLEFVLIRSSWPDEREIALLLFEHLTQPVARYQRVIGFDGRARIEVGVRGDGHLLNQSWEEVFLPRLGAAASNVLTIVDRHLRHAHRLATATAWDDHGWDLPSLLRPAIEDLPTTSPKGPLDVLIRAGRDIIEHLLEHDQQLAAACLASWEASDAPLLHRLAIHAWVVRADVDATAKITWLTEMQWLYKLGLRHEVFRLIQGALADANPVATKALLVQAVRGPVASDDSERRDYRVFSTLSWIAEHAPDMEGVQEALDEIRERHPEFRPSDHPDQAVARTYTDAPGPTPPITADELHQRLESDPATTMQELLQHRAPGTPVQFESSSWDGVRALVAETVSTSPIDGITILDASNGEPDLASPVIRGWTQTQLDERTASLVVHRLCLLDLGPVIQEVAEFLQEQSETTDGPPIWTRSMAAYELADLAWAAIEDYPIDGDQTDWLAEAINDAAGKLTQFHINTIAADWRSAGDHWPGLSAAAGQRLEQLTDGDDHRTAMAQIVLASRLHFFDAADRAWGDAHVLPLLDWTNPERARRAWDGYLYWGRCNDHLLSAGLLRAYVDTAAHAAAFPDELRHQLCEHLASIALMSDTHPLEEGWLTDFTSRADAATRSAWMLNIGSALEELPDDTPEIQWKRWMRRYWIDRVNGLPNQLTPGEVAAMASWILSLTSSIEEAVDIATQRPARLPEHSSLLHKLATDTTKRAPDAFARLLAHLLEGATQPFHECHWLGQVVVSLKTQADAQAMTAIREQALRLGCADAPNW